MDYLKEAKRWLEYVNAGAKGGIKATIEEDSPPQSEEEPQLYRVAVTNETGQNIPITKYTTARKLHSFVLGMAYGLDWSKGAVPQEEAIL